MKCPFCGKEMEKGLLQGSGRLLWCRELHDFTMIPRKGEVMVGMSLASNYWLPAWICKDCKKFVADYSEGVGP